MTRIVDFSDGFTSNSPPSSQIVLEIFDLNNNTSGDLILFDESIATSAIIDYEIERSDSLGDFRQVGRFTCYYNGADWLIDFGMFSGDSLIQASVTSVEHVVLAISTAGQLSYTTGNMTGAGYTGSIKMGITRFKA